MVNRERERDDVTNKQSRNGAVSCTPFLAAVTRFVAAVTSGVLVFERGLRSRTLEEAPSRRQERAEGPPLAMSVRSGKGEALHEAKG